MRPVQQGHDHDMAVKQTVKGNASLRILPVLIIIRRPFSRLRFLCRHFRQFPRFQCPPAPPCARDEPRKNRESCDLCSMGVTTVRITIIVTVMYTARTRI